jgi:hypothetical protein
MPEVVEPNGASQWGSDRPLSAADVDALARKKASLRVALAADALSAKAEYEAHRRAVHVNSARLKALRLARDSKAAVKPKSR